MPEQSTNPGAHHYEIHIPNDFEPIPPNVTDPNEVARLQVQRLARFISTSNERPGSCDPGQT